MMGERRVMQEALFKLFETVVARCMKERIVGGEAFAVDASVTWRTRIDGGA
jgi:hypothetical protein